MSVFKIAWRTIVHRGLGSSLTVISMALGVMLVITVLTIHGVVQTSFKSNSSFGYNLIMGARGGSLQVTANTVFYLSQPAENIPYEYYLAFHDADLRSEEMQHSFAAKTTEMLGNCQDLNSVAHSLTDIGLGSGIAGALIQDAEARTLHHKMDIHEDGIYAEYVDMAIPMCFGDYLDWEGKFRVAATTPDFFSKLVLDIDTEEKFKFADGRAFEKFTKTNGYFEAVVGATVAREQNIKVKDIIYPIHGLPTTPGAHTHEQGFKVVGILEKTGTPHDRAAFVNMEGFFLMEGHANVIEKDLEDEGDDDEEPDEFLTNRLNETSHAIAGRSSNANHITNTAFSDSEDEFAGMSDDEVWKIRVERNSRPLPIEQREVTTVLLRTDQEADAFGGYAMYLEGQIGTGPLTRTLEWSEFRSDYAQSSAMVVNPVREVTGLFATIVDPISWVLLALTGMTVIVSAISILVGVYNSMAQRKREIAIMRALGASRDTVMSVMFCETIILTMGGALFGVLAGHCLIAMVSPIVESRTGVSVGFFNLAPPILPVAEGTTFWGNALECLMSSEVIFVGGMFVLSLIVGIYPAFSAYKTDVSRSLSE